MKAAELIGKKVLRTNPVRYGSGVNDYSYTGGNPVEIKSYNGSHIGIISSVSGEEHFLDPRWDDDNWIGMPGAKIDIIAMPGGMNI